MDKTQLVRKIVEKIAEELRSSNIRPGDQDWYIGFKPDQNTANESEYDPKTGKVVHDTSVGDHTTYLQQWDTSAGGFLQDEDRDSGTYSFKLNNLFRAYAKKTD
jgi:hypothetical protein